MNKILFFLNHPFVKLIFNKLKEVFGSKEFKEFTSKEENVEPITEEVVVKKKKPLQKLVYDNTKQDLHNRIMEERIKNSIMGYANALGM
jgi:hypothetical protein